jgi:hypothetical protein
MFEDTKGVIRRSHAKKNRKYNDQKKRTKRLMINKNNTGNYTPQKT